MQSQEQIEKEKLQAQEAVIVQEETKKAPQEEEKKGEEEKKIVHETEPGQDLSTLYVNLEEGTPSDEI